MVVCACSINPEFQDAIKTDNASYIRGELQAGLDVNATWPNGRTLLTLACAAGSAAVVDVLLESDQLHINKASAFTGDTPLYEAASYGHAAVVRKLLSWRPADTQRERINVNTASTADTETPLVAACRYNLGEAITVVQLLLAQPGIDIHKARSSDGCTALWWACANGLTGVVEQLLEMLHHSNGKPNSPRKTDGATPLYMACQNGHLGAVTALVSTYRSPFTGVHAPLRTDGTTPLHAAASYGCTKSVEQLMAIGANAASSASDGKTPFMEACSGGHLEAAEKMLMTPPHKVETAQTPLDSRLRAIVLAIDKQGNSGAWHAATAGHDHVLDWLREGAGIPVSRDDFSDYYHPSHALPSADVAKPMLAKLDKVRDALNDRAYNNYKLLPLLSREYGLGPDRSASAYLVAASLLATITSVGFLAPPGGYEHLGEIAAPGQLEVLMLFLILNSLSFSLALAAVLLSIKVLFPIDRGMHPLTGCKNDNMYLGLASGTLIAAVLAAALAFTSSLLYPLIKGYASVATPMPGAPAPMPETIVGASTEGVAIVCAVGFGMAPPLLVFLLAIVLFCKMKARLADTRSDVKV